MKRFILVSFAIFGLACHHQAAASQVVLSDSFDTSDSAQSANVNFELALRQVGSVATTSWTNNGLVAVNPASNPNQLLLTCSNGFGAFNLSTLMSPKHSFSESPSFAVNYDMQLGVGGTTPGNDWVALIFGTPFGPEDGSVCTVNGAHGGIGIIFGRNGEEFQFFDNGPITASSASAMGLPAGVFLNCHVRVEVTATGWNSPANFTLFINGQQALFVNGFNNPNGFLTASNTYIKNGGFSANRITLQNVTFAGGDNWVSDAFDNFVVSSLASTQPALTIQNSSGNQVRISWPTSATGYMLQGATSVKTGFISSGLTVAVEGSEFVAYDDINTNAPRYYRLSQ